ncbi:hypothetical protein J4449_02160 [Candidatus Woesearchaeota archaeon]|nr:hypothetical protein [Candidatus Woesearchaeota archaeon]
MKKLIFLILLLTIQLVSAQITIESFFSNPDKVLPGETLRLRLTLENVGEEKIKNIIVKLDLSQIPFAPLSSSTERVIDEIRKDNTKSVNFALVALPNAESQIYKVPVEIIYNETKKTSLISLEVNAKANLDLILDTTEIVKVNDKGKVSLKFVNKGLAQIKFLKVILQQDPNYEILSANSIYIGEVDVDDFESEEFTIIPKTKNPELKFLLEYRDINNNAFTENKVVNLNVYTEDEAKGLGLVNQNINWIFIVLIALVLVLFFVYRRRKKHDA